MIGLVLAFLAGILTILNPCVLPLVPIVVVGAASRDVRAPFALALGLALTFGVVGGFVAAAGVELGDDPVLRTVSALALIGVGAAMVSPWVAQFSERALAPVATAGGRWSNALPGNTLLSHAALGALLAVVWGPCIGPTIGAALLLAAQPGSLPLAMLTMSVFAFGAATSLLVVGFGMSKLTRETRLATRQAAHVARLVFGVLTILVGLAVLTGVDRQIEAALVAAMPDWLVLFATQL